MVELRPYQAQAVSDGLELLKANKIVCLSMEVRTGKTLTALSLAAKYGAKRVLFVSKKKAIVEGSIKKDYELLNPDYDIWFWNYASLHKVVGKFDIVIVDESHSIAAFPKPSKRAKMLKAICKNTPIIYLSGTFTPESYSQLYHQFWISSYSPFIAYSNFYKWAKDYVNVYQKRIGAYKVNNYERAIKPKIDARTKHLFLSVSQEAAGFIQPIKEIFLQVPMNSVQKEMITNIDQRGFTSYAGELCIPANGAIKLSKKAQISGGTCIMDDGSVAVVSKNKVNYIYDRFQKPTKSDSSDRYNEYKIAILYVYQAEGDLLKEKFKNWTSNEDIFRENDDVVFIAQIRSAREGVDLSTADCLVMYSIDFSATSYFQGKARIQSKNRTKPARLYWIFSDGGIGPYVYSAVSKKKNFTQSYYNQAKYNK